MDAATQMLRRAAELEVKEKLAEAKVCYEEGIELLLKTIPEIPDQKTKNYLREKIDKFMKHAEKLKEIVQLKKNTGKFHEKIEITNNQRGCSYSTLFSKYMDEKLHDALIKDAYIRSHHQLVNLVRFCELLLRKSKNLKSIRVVTGRDENNPTEQASKLAELQKSLGDFGITLTLEYSDILHDREIVFDNGWIIKIGRGLDYFKAPKGRISIGAYDMDLRECHETTIDIYDAR